MKDLISIAAENAVTLWFLPMEVAIGWVLLIGIMSTHNGMEIGLHELFLQFEICVRAVTEGGGEDMEPT